MTPERREEIDKGIAWWRKCENWRVNGFGIVNNDPMYIAMAERKVALLRGPIQPEPELMLTCRPWLYDWWHFYDDFVFTGRIKYTHHLGKYAGMALEIIWESEERLWGNMWRMSYKTNTMWVDSDKFEFKPKYVNEYEETIIDCD